MSFKAILTCFIILLAQPSVAKTHLVLTFGLYTSDKPSSMVKQFRPLLNEIENAMQQLLDRKVTIKIQVSRSYEQGLKNLVTGKVDFSRLGPASYVLAKQSNSAVEMIAMEHKNGKKVFYGVIAVAKNSDIKSASHLKGKRFAFGDKNSTIGRYLSQQYLLRHGIREQDLASYEYLGRHDIVGTAVANGTFHAGALKESTFKRLIKKGQPLRQLLKFNNVTKPWVAKGGMDREVFEALQKSLLSLKNTRGLKKLRKSGFMRGNKTDFEEIRQSIEENPNFFKN